MSELIRCSVCGGILSGQAQHSADMPCTCWMRKDEKRTMSESEKLRAHANDLESQDTRYVLHGILTGHGKDLWKDEIANLRQIADSLEISDEELTQEDREAREYLRSQGINPDVSANKVLSKLVGEFVRRAEYNRKRYEAAESYIDLRISHANNAMSEVERRYKQWQEIKKTSRNEIFKTFGQMNSPDKTDSEVLRFVAQWHDNQSMRTIPEYLIQDLRRIADSIEKEISDEEIEKMFDKRYPTMHSHQRLSVIYWFIDGAKWMRDKMQGK